MATEEINIRTTFTDEISTRIQGALDTFVEFGATQDQVADAFERINKTSKTGARGIAQTSNALRKLMDETEDASLAMQGLEKSFEVAKAAGIKLEDAAADVGRALKGQTDILNKFDDQAKAAATAIDGISDPALRARAILLQLNAATRRQNSLVGKLANQFKFAAAVAPNFAKGLKGIAVAFTGAGAAITAFATKSLKTYLDNASKIKKQNEKLSKSLKELEFVFGAIIAQAVGLGDGLGGAQSSVDGLIETLRKNRVPIAQALRDIGLIALEVANAISLPFRGIRLLIAGIEDAVIGTTRALDGFSIFLVSNIKQMLKLIDVAMVAIGKPEKFAKDIERIEANLERGRARIAEMRGKPGALDKVLEDEEKIKAARKRLTEDIPEIEFFKIGKPTDTAGPKKLDETPTAAEALELAPVRDADMPSLLRELTTEEGLGARARQRIAEMSTDTKSLTDLMLGGKQATEELGDAIEGTGAIADQFAQESVKMMVGALDGFVFALAKGGDSMKDFGKGLLRAFGDLTSQIGQALILLSLGVSRVGTGDFSGALGIGIALVSFGAALRGFASRTTGGGATVEGADGSTARALERFGRRLFEREDPTAGREVVINIDGRQMRGFVVDSVNNAVRARQVPALRRST